MAFEYIYNSVALARNFIFGARGDAALARISDVNKPINGLNSLFNYRESDIAFTQVGQGNPSLFYMSDGDPDCASCVGALGQNLPASDPKCGCGGGKMSAAKMMLPGGVTRTGNGEYTIVFNQAIPSFANMLSRGSTVAVVAEQFSNPDHVLVVDKTNLPTSLKLKTYNRATSQYEDSILNGTVIQFRAYRNAPK